MKEYKIDKVTIDISVEMIDEIIIYLFSNSPLLTRKNVSNIYRLFKIMDDRVFENNDDILMRKEFIERVCYAFCKKNIRDLNLLYNIGIDCKYKDELDKTIGEDLLDCNYELKDDEIKYINSTISEKLKYAYLYKFKDLLIDDFERLEIGEYNNLESINKEIQEDCMKLLNKIRKAKAEDTANDYSFDLADIDSYKDVISKTYTALKNPSNKLKTGIKYLNKMLNGGFECGRTYLVLATSGGFKSGFLLSCAEWIRRYNLNLKASSPNKIPTILFISQENSMRETIQRIYFMKTGKEMEKEEDLEKLFVELSDKGFAPDHSTNINLVIQYHPNKSISTDDLYNIIEDLEDNNREVVCLIHDYIKRIRPSNYTKDLRLDLGNIVDEFCVLAKEKNIPILTASQLNRNAFKIIETANQSNKSDAGKLINISDAGESMLMIENADWVAIINQEYKQVDGKDYKYLSFKEGKRRGNKIMLEYFAHPFEDENWLSLVEDEYADKSVSLLELSDSTYIDSSEEIDNLIMGKRTSNSLKRKLKTTKKFNNFGSNKVKEENLDDSDYLNDL